jgi:hypothetical protein
MQHVAVGMTRKQITKQAGENTSNLKVEEIVHGKITCKNIAYCFLRYQGFHLTRPNSQQGLLYRNSDEIA